VSSSSFSPLKQVISHRQLVVSCSVVRRFRNAALLLDRANETQSVQLQTGPKKTLAVILIFLQDSVHGSVPQ
jgi:hypothetical protein